MLKVLAKEPSARYRTADQLGRVVTNFVQQSQPVRSSYLAPGNQTTVPPNAAPVPAFTPLPSQHPARAFGNRAKGYPHHPVHQATPELVVISTQEYRTGADYLTWMLALLALLALIGLIPFWLWVYAVLYPPF